MTEFNWRAIETVKPFLASFTLEDLAEGAEVKPFKPGSRLKYYFAIKAGTDLEWNVKFTRLMRLNMKPEWNSWLGGCVVLCSVCFQYTRWNRLQIENSHLPSIPVWMSVLVFLV